MKKILVHTLASTTILLGITNPLQTNVEKTKTLVENSLNKGNRTIKSVKKAKKILYKRIYPDIKYKKTIYCGCDFENKKDINLTSCNLNNLQNIKRANRIEVEHIVPVQAFGKSFKSYREGNELCVNAKGKHYKGRRCAKKVDKDFKFMESDLYNLYPADGYVNEIRSNYSMGMIPGNDYRIGKKQTTCEIEIDSTYRKIEPRDKIKGDIARVYQYMDLNYPHKGIISKKNKRLFEIWSKLDPISKEECRRYFLIKKVQKNINQILSNTCETKFKQ